MSNRFAWLLGVGVLILIGLLVACSSTYNSASDGLVLVTSQGSALVESFSFSLNKGGTAAVTNTPNDTGSLTCVLNGIPSSIVLDPAGAYAYAILTSSSVCPKTTTGIQAFKVNSDGTMSAVGSPQILNNTILVAPTTVTVPECGSSVQVTFPAGAAPVDPVALRFDSAGQYLFIANTNAAIFSTTFQCNGAPQTVLAGVPVAGTVSVLSVGSGGSLTEVAGSPFSVPPISNEQGLPNLVALAVSPTVFPGPLNGTQPSVCTSTTPPTAEFVYVADEVNSVIWEFAVNRSTGVLGNPGLNTMIPNFPGGGSPLGVGGVAVDPCNRFVYASDNMANKVSAFTICSGTSTQSPTCPMVPDGTLVPVVGSPFSMSGGVVGPGPLVVDPYGNYVYVLSTSNQVSTFRISPVSGSLTSGSPAVVNTGLGPTSLAIRSDDNWLFVANFQAATISEYSIVPQTGSLSALPATTTDNQPFGVAVK